MYTSVNWIALVQVMACRLFDTNSQSAILEKVPFIKVEILKKNTEGDTTML